MKIVQVSPWFGNYRVPVYDYLNKLSGNNFFLLTSDMYLTDLVKEKLHKTLGDHVIMMEPEKQWEIGHDTTDFANATLRLQWQPGLYKLLKEQNPDVVISEGFGRIAPIVIAYAKLHRKKLCIIYERTAHVERNSPRYRTWFRKLIGRCADLFLINGDLTEQYMNEQLGFAKYPKVKGCMVADSHELAKAVAAISMSEKRELASSLNLNTGLTFLFIGQMVERKGIRQLLSAWTKHIEVKPNDNLIVIGSGVLKDSLAEQYAEIASVHILGGIAYDLLHKYYALCDVFIMPTLEDNWCLVIPEAMACHKPVAGSIYNGGTCELVIDGKTGYQFDPLQETSILETLRKFHDSDLIQMGEAAAKLEENFWPDKAARRIYEGIMKYCDK